MQRFRAVLALGLVVVGCSAFKLEAGTIVSTSVFSLPGTSTGTLGPIGATPQQNNDNTGTPNANVIPYSVFFNTLGTLETEFVVDNSGGTTEYRFTQTFVNNTGVPWSGVMFELGFGTGASFVISGELDSLDFDSPDVDPAPTSSLLTTLDHQSNVIVWTGGTVPSVGVNAFTFAVDVPDGLQNYHPGGVNRFTLRQTPIVDSSVVPEPTSVFLAGVGLLATFVAARRRRPMNS